MRVARRWTLPRRLTMQQRGAASILCALLLALLCGSGACQRAREFVAEQQTQAVVDAVPGGIVPKPKRVSQVKLLQHLELCEVRHRGLLIDFTSELSDLYRSPSSVSGGELRRVKRGSEHVAEVLSKALRLEVWFERAVKDVGFSLRAAQGAGTDVSLWVDGKRLGGGKLGAPVSTVIYLGSVVDEIAAGKHMLELRFAGRGKSSAEVKAIVEWLRVHFAEDRDERYAAPTRSNLVSDVALAGKPRTAVALRAPGSVRCPVAPSRGARVRVDVGYWGEGSGLARVDARTANGDVVTLAERRVTGGESAGWEALDMTLDAFAGQLVTLDFSAEKSGVGGRVLFGEPRIELETEVVPKEQAQYAVVVVLGGLERGLVPPWGPREGMPTLFGLSQESMVFRGYHASAASVNGTMASLLTAKSPAEHGVLDASLVLPAGMSTIGEALRKRLGAAAFYSNVPYTFEAFGFGRGWDSTETFSPVEDRPGTEPLLHAGDWLKKRLGQDVTGPQLAFVHLSGAHPPWDVTQDEAKLLPPEDYAGVVEPRRAALALRSVRQRERVTQRVLGPNDWIRVEGLQRIALRKIDLALGNFIAALKQANVWDKTLFVVVGDVGMGERNSVPFSPQGALDEARLAVPLMVKFPGAPSVRGDNQQMIDSSGLGLLIADTIGLGAEFGAEDAERRGISTVQGGATMVPLVARGGERFVIYMGRYRLLGARGEVNSLCDLETDPTCGFDIAPEHPFVVQWLLRMLRGSEENTVSPEYLGSDERTRNALHVYGL
jgi:hypothetical protein